MQAQALSPFLIQITRYRPPAVGDVDLLTPAKLAVEETDEEGRAACGVDGRVRTSFAELVVVELVL